MRLGEKASWFLLILFWISRSRMDCLTTPQPQSFPAEIVSVFSHGEGDLRVYPYLWEVSGDNSSISKFAPCKGPEGFGCRILGRELDVYLAHARGLPTAARGPGDLKIDDSTELCTLVSNVLAYF